MANLRLSKYDPTYRDSLGRYLREDWTSVSDIGKSFAGQILSTDDYFAVENLYVMAIENILQSVGVQEMQVQDLELAEIPDHLDARLVRDSSALLESIQEGMWLARMKIETAVRLALREIAWCKLCGDRGSYIHFGYDYYIYIGFDLDIESVSIPDGIFLELCESPYREV